MGWEGGGTREGDISWKRVGKSGGSPREREREKHSATQQNR